MYTSQDFPTKKAFKQAVADGKKVTVFQPGPFGGKGKDPTDGGVVIEGPQYPRPHKWYAQATLKDGFVVSVK